MFRKTYFLFTLLLILLTVIACGGQNENIAAATIVLTNTNTATATRPQPTNTATSTIFPTVTFTLQPSNTPLPGGVINRGTYIYTEPSDNGAKIATNGNTFATILAISEEGRWYQIITTGGRTGWIHAGEIVGLSQTALDSLPRVTLAPTSTIRPVNQHPAAATN